jgi:hypothetical protein
MPPGLGSQPLAQGPLPRAHYSKNNHKGIHTAFSLEPSSASIAFLIKQLYWYKSHTTQCSHVVFLAKTFKILSSSFLKYSVYFCYL